MVPPSGCRSAARAKPSWPGAPVARRVAIALVVVATLNACAVPAADEHARVASTAPRSTSEAWRTVAPEVAAARLAARSDAPRAHVPGAVYLDLNASVVSARLALAPPEGEEALAIALAPAGAGAGDPSPPVATIDLPRPDGTFEAFAVVASPVMEAPLAEWFALQGFPMRTFRVQGITTPATRGRLDYGGPHGLHATLRGADGVCWSIDPALPFDDRFHVVTRRDAAWGDAGRPAWRCEAADHLPSAPAAAPTARTTPRPGSDPAPSLARGGTGLRTYRFACAATGEFTNYHGGSPVAALAAIVTMTNRLVEVLELDLGLRLVLVADNHLLIHTNPTADPYSDGLTVTMMAQNRVSLEALIGTANYDIGHVVGVMGSAGNAGAYGNACQGGTGGFASPHKAEGATSIAVPVGDPFIVDHVAHAIGHQLGAQHTYNYCAIGSAHGLAVEPGAGVTIMSDDFANCPGDAFEPNTLPMFHGESLLEIEAYLSGDGACFGLLPNGNDHAPTVDAGPDRTIPANTPFELTAAVADLDGDPVTISWEQIDRGFPGTQVTPLAAPNATTGPLFRVHLPTTNPTQSFPAAAVVRAGTPYPLGSRPTTVARTMAFRAVARDAHPMGSRTASDTMTITTAASPGFALTSPNGGASYAPGPRLVTWNVASTDAAPILTSGVDVHLSTDGGVTFPTLLAAALPNTGSGTVTLPNVATTTARLKLKGSGNVFYDISDADFTILGIVPEFDGDGTIIVWDAAEGLANGNGVIEPGEGAIELTFGVRNVGAGTATNVVATLTSLTPTVTVAAAGPRALPDLVAGGAAGANTLPFVIDVDPLHACGAPIDLQLHVSADDGSSLIDLALPTGTLLPTTPLAEEGFEAGALPAGWTTVATTGPDRWDARLGASSAGTPAAGAWLASFEPTASTTTDVRLVTPTLAGATELRFHHAYRVESQTGTIAFDGLVLEVTTNDGATWAPLDDAITTGGPTHFAHGGAASPLATGRPCWSGTSPGFPAMTEVVVDLSPYAGDTIRVAFRYTEDNCCSEAMAGWFVDRVSVAGTEVVCDAVPVELSAFVLE